MLKFNFLRKQKNAENYELYDIFDYLLSQKQVQKAIYIESMQQAADIIASYISKLKMNTYKYDFKQKKIMEDNGFLQFILNVRPNLNENATTFKYNLVYQYLTKGEVLIVEINNKLYLADSFRVTNNIINENYYYNIRLELPDKTTLSINKRFKSSEVIHLKNPSKKIETFLNALYTDYGVLLETARKQFVISNSSKYFMKVPGSQPAIFDTATKKEISYEEYKSKILSSLFDENDGAVLLSEKVNVAKVDNGERKSTTDYINLLDKWRAEVASVYKIPLEIFNKTGTDKSSVNEEFISHCILPIITQVEEEINNAIYGENSFKDGYVRFSRYNLIYHDAISNSTSVDKLFSNGFAHNELRRFLDLDLLDESWANEPNITKNYGSAKGGDNDEK